MAVVFVLAFVLFQMIADISPLGQYQEAAQRQLEMPKTRYPY